MTAVDWSTPEGLAAITELYAARLDGWSRPAAYGVGISPASSSPEWEFPQVNGPGGGHGLPAVILATILRHHGGSATLELTAHELASAIQALEPAQACTSVDHPNLAAWRQLLREAESNPARQLVVVFVARLDDPVESDADASFRYLLEGHGPPPA